MTRFGIFFFCFFFLSLFLLTSVVVAQGNEVLSISSYNLCLNIDTSAQNASNNFGNYLNCTSPDPTLQAYVTNILLRLEATATAGSTFEVALTAVPSKDAAQMHQTTNGTHCDIGNTSPGASPTDCTLTTPANITVLSTKYVYYYNLRRVSDISPQYCYVTRFDTLHSNYIALANGKGILKDSTASWYSNPLFTNAGHMFPCTQQVITHVCGSGTGCTNLENAFSDPDAIARGKFDSNQSTILGRTWYNAEYMPACLTAAEPGEAEGTCRRTMFSFDHVRGYVNSTDYITVFASEPDEGKQTAYYRQPVTLHSRPSNEDFPTCDPVPSSLKAKINTPGYDNVIQQVQCTGFECGIYNAFCFRDTYNDKTGKQKAALCNAAQPFSAEFQIEGTGQAAKPQVLVGIQLSLFSLGPECALYEIDEQPGVAVTVELLVTVMDNSTGVPVYTSQTTTVDNISGGTRANSTTGEIGVRVVSIDTTNGFVGPALPGYIIQCGSRGTEDAPRPKSQEDLKDRRVSLEELQNIIRQKGGTAAGDATAAPTAGAAASPTGTNGQNLEVEGIPFIDMVSYLRPDSAPAQPTWNPWPTITANGGCKDRLGSLRDPQFYPRGCYLGYNPLNKTSRSVMWYYVPPILENTLGRGCNQLGMTQYFWNTLYEQGASPNKQTGIEQCYIDAFECMPGAMVGLNGFSIPGCLASAAFLAADVHSENQFRTNSVQIEQVLNLTMPRNYNPNQPNYWTTVMSVDGGGGVGYTIAYDPSIPGPTGVAGAAPPITFELEISLVGSFVEMVSDIPSGVITAFTCSNGSSAGSYSQGTVVIQNTGSINGSYIVNFECPPSIAVFPETIIVFPEVDAGETAWEPFVFARDVTDSDLGDPMTGTECIANLLPASGAAFAILDSVAFVCGYTNSLDHVYVDPPVQNITPYSPPTLADCGCWDFYCYHIMNESISASPCFYFIVGPAVLAIGMFIVAGILYIYSIRRAKENAATYDSLISRSRGDNT